MPIASRRFADALLAAPSGRIDHASAAQFEADLSALLTQPGAGGSALVLDFSLVDYISSAGLRALMITASQVKAKQGKLAVAALNPVVAEIFAISRFDRVLPVKATLDEALEHCSSAALAAYREATAR